jgi:hypothetical protein
MLPPCGMKRQYFPEEVCWPLILRVAGLGRNPSVRMAETGWARRLDLGPTARLSRRFYVASTRPRTS